VAGGRGNLSTLVEFALADHRPTVGFGFALRQVAHTLGLPLLLGRHETSGLTMLTPADTITWVTAAAVIVLTVVVGRAIARTRVVDLAKTQWAMPTLVALVVGVTVAPHLVDLSLDRPSSTVYAAGAPVERGAMDEMADAIADHRPQLDGPTAILERGDTHFEWLAPGLAVELVERGVDARLSEWFEERQFVHVDRSADRSSATSGLVIVLGDGAGDTASADDPSDIPGDLVAEVPDASGPGGPAYHLRAYLLTRPQLLAFAAPSELGP
jgi:hypothetical protein